MAGTSPAMTDSEMFEEAILRDAATRPLLRACEVISGVILRCEPLRASKDVVLRGAWPQVLR